MDRRASKKRPGQSGAQCETGNRGARVSTRSALGSASAFTLLEVILAVTIAGAILAAAATLIVSVSSVWMERQDRHFFEDHVDGVAEFLSASFTAAGAEVVLSSAPDGTETDPGPSEDRNEDRNEETETGGGGLLRVSDDPIGWSRPPGFARSQDPLLHFGLKDTPPLLIQQDNAPVVGVEVFIHFEQDEGLSLLWYSPLQEDSEDLRDLRRTPVSDLVSKIEYIYWDERFEKWEKETEPKEGEGDEEFLLPRFMTLTFEYEGETKERTITIPIPSRSALIF